MSLRAKSHSDLRAVAGSSLDGAACKALSMSSGSVHRGPRFGSGSGSGSGGEVKGLPRPPWRPVRAVRPVSAAGSSYVQIHHLQGELVRKRKECEDLRRENRYLSNEVHMERIAMRTENELTMRNLRNLNQELQAELKELKQRLCQSQQRAALCSRAADEAEESRGEAEKSRALAEARALGSLRDKEAAEADGKLLGQELLQLKKEHSDLRLLLAQTEKNHLEARLKLERLLGENRALLREKDGVEADRDALRDKLRATAEENVRVKESEGSWRRRAEAAEEESARAGRAREEAEAERRLAERERQDRARESQEWRERHRTLSDRLREEDDRRALSQDKACQANIKSFLLCMTESDQRVKILRSQDGAPRSFTEGEPVYVPTPEPGPEEPERSPSRSLGRLCPLLAGRDQGLGRFDELPAFGGERPDSGPHRRGRKVVDYFWIPTEPET